MKKSNDGLQVKLRPCEASLDRCDAGVYCCCFHFIPTWTRWSSAAEKLEETQQRVFFTVHAAIGDSWWEIVAHCSELLTLTYRNAAFSINHKHVDLHICAESVLLPWHHFEQIHTSILISLLTITEYSYLSGFSFTNNKWHTTLVKICLNRKSGLVKCKRFINLLWLNWRETLVFSVLLHIHRQLVYLLTYC